MTLRHIIHSASHCAGILFLLLSTTSYAQWRAAGPILSVRKIDDGVLLSIRPAILSIQVLSPDVIRIRMSPTGVFAPDSSYAVIDQKIGDQQFTLLDSTRSVTLKTSSLSVRVTKYPCRIAFLDNNGTVINEDDPVKGMEWSGGEVSVWKIMPPDEHYYGFGEKAGSLERRSTTLSNWNSDIPAYHPDTDPLYETIPFFYAIRTSGAYGIFLDNTYQSFFDMGKENRGEYSFGAAGGELNYYFFNGPKPADIIRHFAALVGKMPLPPLYALGYQQSRWSYSPESRVREIAEKFRSKQIPCDVIYLDIDYMDGYRCFTWNKENFPDPKKMVNDLAAKGFKIAVIIDPGIKQDSSYWVFNEGLKQDCFAKYPDGKPFLGKVWPGVCAFPDFTAKNARDWWGTLYSSLVETGIRGFWNDMNEPSVFDVPSKTFDLDVVHDDLGLKSDHRKVHNVYGEQMVRGTYEGVLKLRPDERPFVLTRADYAGGNRYAAAWTGDNVSSWEHLKMAIAMCLNLSISGQPFVGSDIGGFIGNPDGELYSRWLELGVFTPLMRSHSVIDAKNKEPWEYGSTCEQINKKTIGLRYQFLPYIYTSFHESSVTGVPMMRPMVFDYYEDPWTHYNDEQYLFGDALLVAPVVNPGATTKHVRLPAGAWYDFNSDRRYIGPTDIDIDAPIDCLPLFVKAGSALPMQPVVQFTELGREQPLTVHLYPSGATGTNGSSGDTLRAAGVLYEDDGVSFKYRTGGYVLRNITMRSNGNELHIDIVKAEGAYTLPNRTITLAAHRIDREPSSISVDNTLIQNSSNGKLNTWRYDRTTHILLVVVNDTIAGHSITVTQ